MFYKKSSHEVFYKKSSHEVFYKKNFLKNFPILTGKYLCSSWVAFESSCSLSDQISNFLKKRFQRRCFSVNIAKFLKKLILKKICERLLLLWLCSEYCKAKLFIHEDCKISVKCFSTFAGKHLYRSVLFNSCSMQLKLILIQKEVLALVFYWQLS